MINKRLFGSDIQKIVKKKLQARQLLAKKNLDPNSMVSTDYGDDFQLNSLIDFSYTEGFADLSSRTPWVRMWTAVELNNPITYSDNEVIFNPKDFLSEVEGANETIKKFRAESAAKKSAKQKSKKFEGSYVKKRKDGSYVIVGGEASKHSKRVPIATRIYQVGNHHLNQMEGSPTNEVGITFQNQDTNSETEVVSGYNISDIIPGEFQTDNNTFMKPAAGITGISSSTEGTLGVIKKTTINFLVHNWHDFDKIYLRYFLRPGAQLFLDFGWSTTDIYDPNQILKNDDKFEEYLWGEGKAVDEEDGKVTEANGDLETIVGIVTNYTSKVLENGSVECSVEISSKNTALLNEKTTGTKLSKIKYILESLIVFRGIYETLTADEKQELVEKVEEISESSETMFADTSPSAETVVQFNNMIHNLGRRRLRSRNLTPSDRSSESDWGGNALLSGIMVTPNMDYKYVSWGLFEDEVINSEYGFGKFLKDINSSDSKCLSINMDSSNSYTLFDDTFISRQSDIAPLLSEDPPLVILPDNWDETYNTDLKKSPDRDLDDLKNYSDKEYPKTAMDKGGSIKKIPIREVFIRTDIIIDAFDSNETLTEALDDILNEIKKDVGGIWNWQLYSGGEDTKLQVIDSNITQVETEIRGSKGEDFYKNLFTFNVMDQNSIVKGYDLTFDIPQGNVGSMYAIQGMTSETQVRPISDVVDQYLTLEAFEQLGEYFTSYKPWIGDYRINQMDTDSVINSQLFDYYLKAAETIGMSQQRGQWNSRNSRADIEGTFLGKYSNRNNKTSNNDTETQTSDGNADDIVNEMNSIQEAIGVQVLNTATEYWKAMLSGGKSVYNRPLLLPLKLNMTIYGIGNIVPGDCFKVDFLPQKYIDRVYFQVMRVDHNVDETGWYTTLETQFRVRTDSGPFDMELASTSGILKNSENISGNDGSNKTRNIKNIVGPSGLNMNPAGQKQLPIIGCPEGDELDADWKDDECLEHLDTATGHNLNSWMKSGAHAIQARLHKDNFIFQDVEKGLMTKMILVKPLSNLFTFNPPLKNIHSMYSFHYDSEEIFRAYFPVRTARITTNVKDLRTTRPAFVSKKSEFDGAYEQGFGYLQHIFQFTNGIRKLGHCKGHWNSFTQVEYGGGMPITGENASEETKAPFSGGCYIDLVPGKEYVIVFHNEDPGFYWYILPKADNEELQEQIKQLNKPLPYMWWGPLGPTGKDEHPNASIGSRVDLDAMGDLFQEKDTPKFKRWVYKAYDIEGLDDLIDYSIYLAPEDQDEEFDEQENEKITIHNCNMCYTMTEGRNHPNVGYDAGHNPPGYSKMFSAGRGFVKGGAGMDPLAGYDMQHYVGWSHYSWATDEWNDFGPWYCNQGWSQAQLKSMCESTGWHFPIWTPDIPPILPNGTDVYTGLPPSTLGTPDNPIQEQGNYKDFWDATGSTPSEYFWTWYQSGANIHKAKSIQAFNDLFSGEVPTHINPGATGLCKWHPMTTGGAGEGDYSDDNNGLWPRGPFPCGQCRPNYVGDQNGSGDFGQCPKIIKRKKQTVFPFYMVNTEGSHNCNPQNDPSCNEICPESDGVVYENSNFSDDDDFWNRGCLRK